MGQAIFHKVRKLLERKTVSIRARNCPNPCTFMVKTFPEHLLTSTHRRREETEVQPQAVTHQDRYLLSLASSSGSLRAGYCPL